MAPVWVQWPGAVGTPHAIPDPSGATVSAPSPEYDAVYKGVEFQTALAASKQKAYDDAYDDTYNAGYNELKNGSVWQAAYNTAYDYYKPTKQWHVAPIKTPWGTIPGVANECYNNASCAEENATAAGDDAVSTLLPAVKTAAEIAGEAAKALVTDSDPTANAAGLAAVAAYNLAHPDAPLTETIQVPKTVYASDYTTYGAWVTADTVSSLPEAGQVAYWLNLANNGDITQTPELAKYLNWTTYLTNVNLIAYGDGAIAAGEAYRQYIEAGNFTVGEAQTGPREITLSDGSVVQVKDNGTIVLGDTYMDAAGNWIKAQAGEGLEYPESGTPPDATIVKPGGVIDITLLTLNLLRNPGRPNGGLYSRFAPIYQEITGVNPVSPERTDIVPVGVDIDIAKLLNGEGGLPTNVTDIEGLVKTIEAADGEPIILTFKTDMTWEYDLLSDAPATANPIAWANSTMSSMMAVTYGSELVNMATGNSDAGIGAKAYIVPTGEYDAGTVYVTLTTEQLPLLAPARLVAGLLSAATGENINTPVADALEPVLKLLVNTSYTDAVRNPDGSWSRSLDEMHIPTLFGTQTITREQAALLAGDILGELGRGVGLEYTDVIQRVTNRTVNFLEDNDIQVPTEIKTAAAKLATEPGKAIQKVSRQIGDDVSKVLGGIEAKLPEGPAAPTQEQLADLQRPVGKVLAAANDATGGVVFKETTAALNDPIGVVINAGKDVETKVTKQVTKTQKSLTHAQERAAKVGDKLKQGDVKGAVKQVGENVKNRVDRVKKDINNGVDKLKGKDKDKTDN